MEFDHLLAGPGQRLWIHTSFLIQLFLSLPIPGALRNILCDIYRDKPIPIRRWETTGSVQSDLWREARRWAELSDIQSSS